MSEVCANCECRLDESCCGRAEPYALDGIDYCCQGCAVDGACTCGCVAPATPADPAAGQAPGPLI